MIIIIKVNYLLYFIFMNFNCSPLIFKFYLLHSCNVILSLIHVYQSKLCLISSFSFFHSHSLAHFYFLTNYHVVFLYRYPFIFSLFFVAPFCHDTFLCTYSGTGVGSSTSVSVSASAGSKSARTGTGVGREIGTRTGAGTAMKAGAGALVSSSAAAADVVRDVEEALIDAAKEVSTRL